MISIHFRGGGSDHVSVMAHPNETLEKVMYRIGQGGKGFIAVDKDGEVMRHKKTISDLRLKDSCTLELARYVKVFDPVNKQPYRLRFGGEKSEVLFSAGLESYLTRAAGNKRVFLCKKYQVKQCRAQTKCNSIHADRKIVQAFRKAHPASEGAMRSEKQIEVYSELDDERFFVPLDRIIDTTGSTNALSGARTPRQQQCSLNDSMSHRSDGSASSTEKQFGVLCPLFDQKVPSCPHGAACENIHIDAPYLRHTKSMWKVPCCSQLSCLGNVLALSQKKLPTGIPLLSGGRQWEYLEVTETVSSQPVNSAPGRIIRLPGCCVTPTKGLKELCEAEHSDALVVAPTSVCRPHQRKACKWGADCNNVHICRVRLPPHPGSLSAKSSPPPTSPMNIPFASEDVPPPLDELIDW